MDATLDISCLLYTSIAAGDEERILSMADDVASYTAAGDEAWRASQFAKAGILDRRGDAAAAQKIYKVLSANVKTPEGEMCIRDR